MRLTLEPHATVIDENGVARLHVFGEPLVDDRDGVFFGEAALLGVLDEGHLARGGEHVGATRKRAACGSWGRTNLAGRRPAFCSEWPLRAAARAAFVLGMAAVREVEPRDIHASVDEPLERFERITGGTDGANDFGSSFKH